MSWMPTVTNDEVYRATIVVEQRSLTDDRVIQTWSVHSKSYAKPQGASMWLNEQVYEFEANNKAIDDHLDGLTAANSDWLADNPLAHVNGTREVLVEGTGVYIATEWTPYIKKKDRK